ncbi:DUF1684 domain-containing protein [Halegenticoccus tardaugens]|uniref:DUF1684 domain-containing protein n=1 Tax=Halegenticoccus tardaugens TaxID=2071624 RepID=UPI00100B6618|nr:DUF1684 domain-containing protein [Halegenticoccus tardaugens]
MSASPDWADSLERHRREKDEYFRDHPHSPIPPDGRESFAGLNYYPPNPDYRFELPLSEHDEKESVTLATTTDGEREYLEWGEFGFDVGGEECSLRAYKSDPTEGGFWLPFRDRTSGEETYGGGRYLDLDTTDDRTDGGLWIVDFNLAYNPFCVYSERYECPLVPMENWLDVRIEAGEKAYRTSESYEPDEP